MVFREKSLLLVLVSTGLATALTGGCGESSNDSDGSGEGGATSRGAGGGEATPGEGSTGRALPCDSDKDCREAEQLCDTARLVCVDCLVDADCGEDALCANAACVLITPCSSSKDCSVDQVCSEALGFCVDCVGDNDCATGESCYLNQCLTSCASDKDCASEDAVCDNDSAICVECVKDADCSSGTYCDTSNACSSQVCSPGQTSCAAGEVSTCNARGESFTLTTCEDGCNAAGNGCSAGGGECEGDEGCDCYPNDTCNGELLCISGTCETDGCAGTTGDMCSSIPKFSGIQIVDGDDADFCDVPATVVTFASSELQVVENDSADTSKSRATFRVAWEEKGLRAHVHVRDPLVHNTGAESWDGDNVQFFVSSGPPIASQVSGATNLTHITVVPKAGGTPGLTYSGDIPSLVPYTSPKFYSDLVSDGYVIEMFWPWRKTAPEAATQIAFDVMVGVDDTPETPGRDFEYAYAYNGPIVGDKCGAMDDALWCDSRFWCSTTLSSP